MKRAFTAPPDSERCEAGAESWDHDGGARCMHRRKHGELCAQHWRKASPEVISRMLNGATYWDAMYAEANRKARNGGELMTPLLVLWPFAQYNMQDDGYGNIIPVSATAWSAAHHHAYGYGEAA